ncbi:MAG: hypothetical protein WCI88_07665 [Chloroflexota bacterium]
MTIHVEPQNLHETGIELRCAASELWERLASLRAYADRLDMAWQGGAFQEDYLRQYRSLLNHLAEEIQNLDDLSGILLRQAEGWEALAADCARRYADLNSRKRISP